MNNKETTSKNIYTCNACGATYDEEFAYCPYCGSINIIGAEKEYFKDLKKVEDDLAEMGDDSREEFNKTFKSGIKFAIVVISIVVAIAAAVGILIKSLDSFSEKSYEKQLKAEKKWKTEYYPQLDELYAEGEYDEILDLTYEHSDDKGYCFYSWEHYGFLAVYQHYTWMNTNAERIKEAGDNPNSDDILYLIYDGIDILIAHNSNSWYGSSFDTNEQETISLWAEEVPEVLNSCLGMTSEDIEDILINLYEQSGYLDLKDLKSYLKKNNYF